MSRRPSDSATGTPGQEPLGAFTRIARVQVTERVSRQIIDSILTRQLLPGQKLPSEKALIAAMGVSRASVREALRGLTVLGFLESRQGSGHFVRPSAALEQVRTRVGTLLGDHTGIADLQEARRAVEPVAVALAAQRATADELRQMEETLREYEEAIRRDQPVYELGERVHESFAMGCHNPPLRDIVLSLIGVTGSLQREIYVQAGVRHGEHDVQDHRDIYNAIAARLADDALHLMIRHLGRVERALFNAVVTTARAAFVAPVREPHTLSDHPWYAGPLDATGDAGVP